MRRLRRMGASLGCRRGWSWSGSSFSMTVICGLSGVVVAITTGWVSACSWRRSGISVRSWLIRLMFRERSAIASRRSLTSLRRVWRSMRSGRRRGLSISGRSLASSATGSLARWSASWLAGLMIARGRLARARSRSSPMRSGGCGSGGCCCPASRRSRGSSRGSVMPRRCGSGPSSLSARPLPKRDACRVCSTFPMERGDRSLTGSVRRRRRCRASGWSGRSPGSRRSALSGWVALISAGSRSGGWWRSLGTGWQRRRPRCAVTRSPGGSRRSSRPSGRWRRGRSMTRLSCSTC
jgi:hypothetical protein